MTRCVEFASLHHVPRRTTGWSGFNPEMGVFRKLGGTLCWVPLKGYHKGSVKGLYKGFRVSEN